MFRVAVGCVCVAWLLSPQQQTGEVYKQKTRTFHSAAEFAQKTGGKLRIDRALDPRRHAELRQTAIHWPSIDFTVIGVESPSVTWVGTRQGAIRVTREPQAVEHVE